MSSPSVPYPAATVVLLRDRDFGCEVLLVQRNAKLSFHGGAWVFPGGRLDPGDYTTGDDIVAAARQAVVREAREEAGMLVDATHLVLISRWITPEILAKRFDTWFFLGRAGDEAVQVDGGEIRAHRWYRPADALAAQRAGDIDLPPPTFVTLLQIANYSDVSSALATMRERTAETFAPRPHAVQGGACTVYAGDAAYDGGNLDQPGPRHRLWMVPSGWRYERSG